MTPFGDLLMIQAEKRWWRKSWGAGDKLEGTSDAVLPAEPIVDLLSPRTEEGGNLSQAARCWSGSKGEKANDLPGSWVRLAELRKWRGGGKVVKVCQQSSHTFSPSVSHPSPE